MATEKDLEDTVSQSSDECVCHENVNTHCLDCRADICNGCRERCLAQGHNVGSPHPLCKHHTKPFVTFCKQCKEPCCVICITKQHAGHTFTTIEDAAKETRINLEVALKTQDTMLTKLQNTRKDIEDDINAYNNAIQNALDTSRERVQLLRQQFEKTEERWFQRLGKIKADAIEKMETIKGNIDNQMRSKQQYIDDCKTTLAEGSDLAVLLFQSAKKDEEHIDMSDDTLPQLATFMPSNCNLSSTKALIGVIHHQPMYSAESKNSNFVETCIIIISIFLLSLALALSSFHEILESKMIQVTDIKTITNIYTEKCDTLIHTADNKIWVHNVDTSKRASSITLYDANFNEINTIHMPSWVSDIIPTSSGDVLATVSVRLIRISPSGSHTTLYNSESDSLSGLCINDQNQIVVGISLYVNETTVLRKLTVFSSNGSKVLREIEVESSGKRLFNRYLHSVKQNGNGDYIVSQEDGIVCVTREGEYRWKYETNSVIYGSVCDRYNNIIIAEHSYHQIKMLSSEGKLIKTLLTQENGISFPNSLSTDTYDNLWIGQDENILVCRLIYRVVSLIVF